MTSKGKKANHHQISEYSEAYEALHRFTAKALIDFAAQASNNAKNHILKNFTAGAIERLASIILLCKAGQNDDCHILFRALLDRFIHLKSLVANDEFDEFERWSLEQKHSDIESALNDPQIRAKIPEELRIAVQRARTERNKHLQNAGKSTWHRPHARPTLTDAGLAPVYIAGYDFASTKVHPMADDGQVAFLSLTNQPHVPTDEGIMVVHNSFAVANLVVLEWLSASHFQWKEFVVEFYTQITKFLESGSREYLVVLDRALQLVPDLKWGELNKETQT